MHVIECDSWREFCDELDQYLSLEMRVRQQYIFRGHADARWKIKTTFDRFVEDELHVMHKQIRNQLLSEFVEECKLIDGNVEKRLEHSEHELEMLARHHGLPSTILDFTASPFVAAFFAFSDPIHKSKEPPDKVCIWMLDRECFDITSTSDSRMIAEAYQLITGVSTNLRSVRAAEQRSCFLVSDEWAPPVADAFKNYLVAFRIPACECNLALEHLDELGTNARSLFRDFDAAARTAAWRSRLSMEGAQA